MIQEATKNVVNENTVINKPNDIPLQTASVTVVYQKSCDLAQDLISENYPSITKVLIRPESDQFQEKLADSFIQ